jgi:protein tyrosine phosphatase type 4A
MGTYVDELKKYHVSTVVRVCEPTYSPTKLVKNGIDVLDLSFPDGQPPPQSVIDDWLNLLRRMFIINPNSNESKRPSSPPSVEDTCVAVHCVAGLGRAPVLVAIALMELGMKYEDAVELIRAKRRGAINSKQLSFLEKYKPKSRLKPTNGGQCILC